MHSITMGKACHLLKISKLQDPGKRRPQQALSSAAISSRSASFRTQERGDLSRLCLLQPSPQDQQASGPRKEATSAGSVFCSHLLKISKLQDPGKRRPQQALSSAAISSRSASFRTQERGDLSRLCLLQPSPQDQQASGPRKEATSAGSVFCSHLLKISKLQDPGKRRPQQALSSAAISSRSASFRTQERGDLSRLCLLQPSPQDQQASGPRKEATSAGSVFCSHLLKISKLQDPGKRRPQQALSSAAISSRSASFRTQERGDLSRLCLLQPSPQDQQASGPRKEATSAGSVFCSHLLKISKLQDPGKRRPQQALSSAAISSRSASFRTQERGDLSRLCLLQPSPQDQQASGPRKEATSAGSVFCSHLLKISKLQDPGKRRPQQALSSAAISSRSASFRTQERGDLSRLCLLQPSPQDQQASGPRKEATSAGSVFCSHLLKISKLQDPGKRRPQQALSSAAISSRSASFRTQERGDLSRLCLLQPSPQDQQASGPRKEATSAGSVFCSHLLKISKLQDPGKRRPQQALSSAAISSRSASFRTQERGDLSRLCLLQPSPQDQQASGPRKEATSAGSVFCSHLLKISKLQDPGKRRPQQALSSAAISSRSASFRTQERGDLSRLCLLQPSPQDQQASGPRKEATSAGSVFCSHLLKISKLQDPGKRRPQQALSSAAISSRSASFRTQERGDLSRLCLLQPSPQDQQASGPRKEATSAGSVFCSHLLKISKLQDPGKRRPQQALSSAAISSRSASFRTQERGDLSRLCLLQPSPQDQQASGPRKEATSAGSVFCSHLLKISKLQDPGKRRPQQALSSAAISSRSASFRTQERGDLSRLCLLQPSPQDQQASGPRKEATSAGSVFCSHLLKISKLQDPGKRRPQQALSSAAISSRSASFRTQERGDLSRLCLLQPSPQDQQASGPRKEATSAGSVFCSHLLKISKLQDPGKRRPQQALSSAAISSRSASFRTQERGDLSRLCLLQPSPQDQQASGPRKEATSAGSVFCSHLLKISKLQDPGKRRPQQALSSAAISSRSASFRTQERGDLSRLCLLQPSPQDQQASGPRKEATSAGSVFCSHLLKISKLQDPGKRRPQQALSSAAISSRSASFRTQERGDLSRLCLLQPSPQDQQASGPRKEATSAGSVFCSHLLKISKLQDPGKRRPQQALSSAAISSRSASFRTQERGDLSRLCLLQPSPQDQQASGPRKEATSAGSVFCSHLLKISKLQDPGKRRPQQALSSAAISSRSASFRTQERGDLSRLCLLQPSPQDQQASGPRKEATSAGSVFCSHLLKISKLQDPGKRRPQQALSSAAISSRSASFRTQERGDLSRLCLLQPSPQDQQASGPRKEATSAGSVFCSHLLKISKLQDPGKRRPQQALSSAAISSRSASFRTQERGDLSRLCLLQPSPQDQQASGPRKEATSAGSVFCSHLLKISKLQDPGKRRPQQALSSAAISSRSASFRTQERGDLSRLCLLQPSPQDQQASGPRKEATSAGSVFCSHLLKISKLQDPGKRRPQQALSSAAISSRSASFRTQERGDLSRLCLLQPSPQDQQASGPRKEATSAGSVFCSHLLKISKLQDPGKRRPQQALSSAAISSRSASFRTQERGDLSRLCLLQPSPQDQQASGPRKEATSAGSVFCSHLLKISKLQDPGKRRPQQALSSAAISSRSAEASAPRKEETSAGFVFCSHLLKLSRGFSSQDRGDLSSLCSAAIAWRLALLSMDDYLLLVHQEPFF
ncbi:UNVERIFIED_CONTAM: hypothetical protein FKN15_059136 [Acipenser sinensis]